MAHRIERRAPVDLEWHVVDHRGHTMPAMVVARTDEEIERVIATTAESSRLFEVRVQRYWNQWNLNCRLFALGWAAATLLTLILATVGGVINADRLGLVPMCPVGGYLGYRLTRSRWPGLFDAYVSAREKARADHPTS